MRSQEKIPVLTGGKLLRRTAAAIIVVLISWGISSPLAEGASFRYLNNVPLSEGEDRSSNLRANVTGGSTTSHGTGFVTNHIISYNPAPGYVEHGHSWGSGGTNLTHPAVTNAYSSCYWTATGMGGTAHMSCWVNG